MRENAICIGLHMNAKKIMHGIQSTGTCVYYTGTIAIIVVQDV